MQLVWDVTCPDTLTSKEAGKAAEKAEKEKIQKYQELANKYIVMPGAFETLGSWGQSSLKFIQEIGERMKIANAQWKEYFSKHLWFAFVVVFLAEIGRIPCCGRAESSSSNI